MLSYSDKDVDRFISKVAMPTISDPGACWLWSAGRRGAYGRIWIGGSARAAHRVSWELHHGPVPEGMIVCHKCDVPACVNPDHLFIGTYADNTADMISKGRGVLSGSSNHNAKYTEEQISHAVSLVRNGYSQTTAAKETGVHIVTLNAVLHGRQWRGLCEALGIEYEEAADLVAESNLTKQPTPRGKVKKGLNYREPDMRGAVL